MKILFYNHTGQVSGAERVLMMILNGINRERFDCAVACPENSKMFELAKTAAVPVRGLLSLEARFTWRPGRLFRYLLSFVQVIRNARSVVISEAPDAIHANSIRAGIVMAGATIGLSVPVIWHAHDVLPHHPLSTLVRLFALMSSRNQIVAVSNAVAKRFRGVVLRPFASRVPIRVIHNSVDLDRFHPDARTRAAMRRALKLTGKQPAVGIVGQLTPRKGQYELIEAFAEVSNKIPAAQLLIIGEALFNRDHEYGEQLRVLAERLGISGSIKFLGARSDVPELIQALDVLVINSHEEPFGLTVLEGFACGTAVLATAVGGTPEMINHRYNGALVPPRDGASLAATLVELLQDDQLRTQLGRNGRLTAITRFSMDRFYQEIDSLFSQLVRRADKKLSPQFLDEKLAID